MPVLVLAKMLWIPAFLWAAPQHRQPTLYGCEASKKPASLAAF
jgi:hypothetical protein